MDTDKAKLITRRRFRELQGVSMMTQFRREKSLEGYPKPVVISNRVYFYEAEAHRFLNSLRAPPEIES